MNLKKILFYIQKYIGIVEKKRFTINIKINSKKIDLKGIKILYFLLNNYEDYYFITIENLPYCLMPDAKEHIIYKKNNKKNYYYDKICKNCDFRKICSGWQASIDINRKKIKPARDIPNEIVIEVTTKCNLNCKTCSLDKSKPLDISFKTAERIIDEAKSLGIKSVRFTGGEPFLNKDIEKMLIFAKSNNFYVLLNTNATVINNTTLKLLENTVDNILISLQGFNQKSDSLLTDSNVEFNKKIANIIRLKSKIPIIRIGTVISKTLISNIAKYYNLLKSTGIENWELYRPIIKNNRDKEFKISKRDLIKVMRFLLSLKKRRMKVKIANPVPFCISKNINLSLATLLGAVADDGHSRIVLDSQGYFKPSYFINENLGKTIKEAWDNPFLKKMRTLNYLPLKCKKCSYLKWCKGGSRALAKIIKGDYFSIDPLIG